MVFVASFHILGIKKNTEFSFARMECLPRVGDTVSFPSDYPTEPFRGRQFTVEGVEHQIMMDAPYHHVAMTVRPVGRRGLCFREFLGLITR